MRGMASMCLMLMACGPPAVDGSDEDSDLIDPYEGIEPADAIVPLSSLEGRSVFHLMDAATDGEHAWFATFRGGLSLDLSDPASPTPTEPPFGGRLYGADFDEDHVLFSGRESGVYLLSRNEDGTLGRLARRTDDAEAPERAILLGEVAVIAAQTDGVIVARLSDLQTVGELDLPNVFAIAAAGEDRVVVGDRERGLVLVDVSDPTAPSELGAIELAGDAQDLVVDGDTAWVAAGSRVFGVDLSEPSAPRLITAMPTLGVATRLAISDDRLAVAAWTDTRLYDVSDPAEPVLLATEDATEAATSVTLHGDLLLVGDWNAVRVYEIDAEAWSAELRADRYALLVGEGEVASNVLITNEGRLPLELGAVSCDDARITPELGEDRLLPGEVTSLLLSADSGDGSPFEATCTLPSSDVDEPSHPILVRVNPSGLSVGDRAPDFTLPDLDGTLHSLTDTQGKVVIISVFSSL